MNEQYSEHRQPHESGDVEQQLAEIGTIPKEATVVTYCT